MSERAERKTEVEHRLRAEHDRTVLEAKLDVTPEPEEDWAKRLTVSELGHEEPETVVPLTTDASGEEPAMAREPEAELGETSKVARRRKGITPVIGTPAKLKANQRAARTQLRQQVDLYALSCRR